MAKDNSKQVNPAIIKVLTDILSRHPAFADFPEGSDDVTELTVIAFNEIPAMAKGIVKRPGKIAAGVWNCGAFSIFIAMGKDLPKRDKMPTMFARLREIVQSEDD